MCSLELRNPLSTAHIFASQRPLQPSSESALNVQSAPDTSRKRKRCEIIGTSKYEDYITIQPHSSSSSTTLLRLKARILIPRSSLYLQLFNRPLADQLYIGARLFRGKIELLDEKSASHQDNVEQQILVAEDDNGLYAIERVAENIHTLSRFGHEVTLDRLSNGAGTLERVSKRRKDGPRTGAPWWKAVAMELPDDEGESAPKSQSCKDYGDFRIIMEPPPASSVENLGTEESIKRPPVQDATTKTNPETTSVSVQDGTPSQPLCIEEVKTNIRTQYQEALYISKTSLAYFTKGPLSRARATANQDTISSQMRSELSEFLRSSLLCRSMTEAKYMNTIPAMLQDFPVGVVSDDEELISTLGETLRKSRKRKKLAKNGLLPGEEEYIAKWFINKERAHSVDDTHSSRAERIKTFLVEIRARETQLQLILILEILLLDVLGAGHLENSESRISDEAEKPDSQDKIPKKSKKPMDLQVLMELLVERLCIWQSTTEGQTKMTVGDISEIHGGTTCTSSNTIDEQLKQFCTEIVVPFYAARLPEACSSICQKLGGPGAHSPARPSLAKLISSNKIPSRPNTALPQPKRSKQKTLKRLLTDEKKALSRPPRALTRSTTDSALLGIKREPSDVSLSSIPAAKGRSQIPKQYSQREVDLTVASQATQAKLKKKMAFEQDLKGAIAALRRPNPRLAVKDFVDSADKRAAVAGSRSRKSKNPVRNPFAQDVQVMATPKANRTRDVFDFRLEHNQDQFECIPPSSNPRVPSSSRQPQLTTSQGGSTFSSSRLAVPPAHIIQQTPTKRSSKLGRSLTLSELESSWSANDKREASPELPDLPIPESSEYTFKRSTAPRAPCTPSRRKSLLEATIAVTPVMDRRKDVAAVQCTPVLRRNSLGGDVTPMANKNALGTGLSLLATNIPARPSTPPRPNTATGMSAQTDIYKALGWDDDDDDYL